MKPDPDTLTAYALGLLEGDELREVEAYLDAHPEEAAEVRADQEALAQLVLSLPPEPLPEGSEDRLIARLREETVASPAKTTPSAPAPVVLETPPSARRASWWPLPIAAGIAMIVALSWPSLQDWQVQRTLSQYQSQPGAVTRELRGPAGQQIGTLVRLPDGRAFVVLNDDPESGKVYQAWSVADGAPVSLGVFDGRRMLTPPLNEGAAFAVSVEPPGGSRQPTTTPITVLPL